MLCSVRILLLHTGGTLMMRTSGSTPLKPARYTRDLVGELPMLNKIADFYEEEVDVAVASLTSLLEPLMMVFIGGIVGVILIAMYMPIFSIAGKVQAE